MLKSFFLAVLMLAAAGKLSAQVTSPDQSRPQEGEGWVKIESGTTSTFTGISPQPSGVVWMRSSKGIFKSLDRGKSWFHQPQMRPGQLTMTSDLEGYQFGGIDTVRTTTDGGNEWRFAGLHQMNGTQGFVTIGLDTVFAFNGFNISRSTDKGETWFNRQLDAQSFEAGSFIDSRHGIIAGAAQFFEIDSPESGSFVRTSNGGESWENLWTHLPFGFSDVQMLSKDTIILVSVYGAIAKSTNRGDSWTYQIHTDLGFGFTEVDFRGSIGYAVGSKGSIFRTTNSGDTWIKEPVISDHRLYCVRFIDDTTVIAGGAQGTILRTTSAGKSTVLPDPRLPLSVRNYPEPFSATTTITFTLPESQKVSLALYASDGRLIQELLSNVFLPAGLREVRVEGTDLAAGTYLYRLASEKYTAEGRITIVR